MTKPNTLKPSIHLTLDIEQLRSIITKVMERSLGKTVTDVAFMSSAGLLCCEITAEDEEVEITL